MPQDFELEDAFRRKNARIPKREAGNYPTARLPTEHGGNCSNGKIFRAVVALSSYPHSA